MSGCVEDSLRELKALPLLEPPAELEATTLEAMAAAVLQPRRLPLAQAAVWVSLISAGALLAALAVSLRVEDESRQAATPIDALYFEFAETAAELEAILAQLPEPRRVMRADTASTIVGLEDRIAVIDAELTRAEAERVPAEYRAALLRDRIEVMNALVNVRYAQSRAFIF